MPALYIAVNDLACTVARGGRARGGSAADTLDIAVWMSSMSPASVHPVHSVQSSYCSAVPTVEATEAVASAKIDAAQLKDLL